MKIGILQTGHAPDEVLGTLGDYDAMFQRLLGGHGFLFETFNVVDMAFPAGPELCDGWLVTGSGFSLLHEIDSTGAALASSSSRRPWVGRW